MCSLPFLFFVTFCFFLLYSVECYDIFENFHRHTTIAMTSPSSNVTTTKEKWVSMTSEPTTPGLEKRRVYVNGKEIVFRVVNGSRAQLGDVPYQVSLRKQVKRSKWFLNFCGASIVKPTVLLSAAHCFRKSGIFDSCCANSGRPEKNRMKGVYAVAGVLESATRWHGLGDSTKHGQWRTLRAVRFPTDFNFPKNDIAVIFVTKPFNWTDYIKPIPYGRKRIEYRGSCLVSGYGRVRGHHRSSHLLWAYLRILNKYECRHIHNRNMERMICTSDEVSDSNKGDSGGPLVCKNTGDPAENAAGLLVGIVSGARKGVRDGSFFARVASFTKFIEGTIRRNNGPRLKSWWNCVIVSSLLYVSL